MFEKILNLLSVATEFVKNLQNLENRVSTLEQKIQNNVTVEQNAPVAESTVKTEATASEVVKTETAATEVKIPSRKHWPKSLHKIAVELFNKGRSYDEISVEIGVTPSKVRDHIYKTVIYPGRKNNKAVQGTLFPEASVTDATKNEFLNQNRRWNIKDTLSLYALSKSGYTIDDLSKLFNRSEHAIRTKLYKIQNNLDTQLTADGSRIKK